jgi:hypothetical protein
MTIKAMWLSRSCSRSSRRSNRPGRCSGRHSSTVVAAVAAEIQLLKIQLIEQHTCLQSRRLPPPPLPLSCICKITGSGETSVVTFVAAFAEVEEAAVEVVEIVTRGELRACRTVVSASKVT